MADLIPLTKFWQPRYWPVWLGVATLRLLVCLPQPVRMACGRGLGTLIKHAATKRRRVATRNIEICFPELSTAEREDLVDRHFDSLGMGVIELGLAWWKSDAYLQNMVDIQGIEHLHSALDKGHGVLMLSGHFSTTEIIGRPLQLLLPPVAAMYRPSNNSLTDQLMRRCRGKSVATLITKREIRLLLKVLKENRPVWYAADQAYNRKGTVLVPFFSEMATTNTSVSQIAKIGKSPVVPFFPYRIGNGKSYKLKILPALENFPSGDDTADAARLNRILEDNIREAPEQYYWVHRRFKGRPEEYPDLYAD